MQNFDIIIVGAGAAGLMCATQTSKRGKNTLIIESSSKIGEKIRISGGGRCNFTNLNISSDNFLSQNPRFCISALKRFTQFDFINLVKKHKINYHEKTLGQLFCDKSSKQIIEMLLAEIDNNFAQIKTQCKIKSIAKNQDKFIIKTSSNEEYSCNSLVIASGGLSIPKMGASDFGYKIAKQFGIKIVKTEPALVPIVLKDEILQKTRTLAGVSCEAITKINKQKFKEGLLFTHKGLSGPSILQISSYLNQKNEIEIDLLAQKVKATEFLKQEKEISPKQSILSSLSKILPKNLAAFIIKEVNLDENMKLAEINNKTLQKISSQIQNWIIKPETTEGYAKAEVTLGGVDTNEISSKTFESKKVKNLYFIGEVLDVTGHLGGYNFQWAWSSGFAAGNSI